MFTTNDTTVNSVNEHKTKIAQLEKEVLSLKQRLNTPCASSSDQVRQFRTMLSCHCSHIFTELSYFFNYNHEKDISYITAVSQTDLVRDRSIVVLM